VDPARRAYSALKRLAGRDGGSPGLTFKLCLTHFHFWTLAGLTAVVHYDMHTHEQFLQMTVGLGLSSAEVCG